MRKTVNPGRRLELRGSLELQRVGARRISEDVRCRCGCGGTVTLAQLLDLFREDPDDDVIGPVRITIEPERWNEL